MSLLWTLKKYVDSIEQREVEAAGQRDRDVAGRQKMAGLPPAGDSPDPPPPPLRQCRVCGTRSREAFCPECLADTLVPLEAPEKP